MRDCGVTVGHTGSGGDAFHAPARALYEFLAVPRADTVLVMNPNDTMRLQAGGVLDK